MSSFSCTAFIHVFIFSREGILLHKRPLRCSLICNGISNALDVSSISTSISENPDSFQSDGLVGHVSPMGKHSWLSQQEEKQWESLFKFTCGPLDEICRKQEDGQSCQKATTKKRKSRDLNSAGLCFLFISWQPGEKPLTENHLPLPLERLKESRP